MKTTKEIWRDIPNYEGYYQVSNLGRVKSLSRKTNNRNGGYTTKERILKAGLTSGGYLVTSLFKEGKGRTFNVHQLVAMAFLNHIPCGHKIVVDHINNIKTDNRVENFQLTTHRHNSSKDKKGKSKYTGVFWYKARQKWRSHIYINGKLKHLGYYDNELDAHEAYQKELEKFGGYNG